MITPDRSNPFALVKAADYSDRQINDLWVELGATVIQEIIEPQGRISKFILGSKGSGKTHLLRYHSYPVIRLRRPRSKGLAIVADTKYLATFLRTTGMDAARFEWDDNPRKWQQLFGVYLELRLAEGLLEALRDVESTSGGQEFDDVVLLAALREAIAADTLARIGSLEELHAWVVAERRAIDEAINQAAFTEELRVRIPFSLGSLLFSLCNGLPKWSSKMEGIPLIFLLDEIENFSARQQQVVNTLIRYGEGLATFRVSGRLYSVRTHATIADGEENREGSEFKTTNLDEILRRHSKFPQFARKFLTKRLESSGAAHQSSISAPLDIAACFEELSTSEFYAQPVRRWNLEQGLPDAIRAFCSALRAADATGAVVEAEPERVASVLTEGFPALLQKLNMLLFCKKASARDRHLSIAQKLRSEAIAYVESNGSRKGAYATAYGHYSSDLFAQLCRASAEAPDAVYAGFDTFVRMACGNPKNLLILLGRTYSIASFRGLPFSDARKLSLETQTDGAELAARFLFESDSNFGSPTEVAKEAISRLASLLKAARFALSIPEVSPLTVSFNEVHLSEEARLTLRSTLNWSFVFEIFDGRPDRNRRDQRNRKIQLNPLLSPYWSLPTGRRGDLSLPPELANAIFSPKARPEFDQLLKLSSARWNQPFKIVRQTPVEQPQLF